MATMETITVGGSPMEIYCDGPKRGNGRRGPAILLMYHREGIDDFTKGVVKILVDAGYVVAVPDVSHRTSRDVPMKDRKQYFKDSEVVADMRAALDFLRARPDVDPDAICLMGHCMGGRMTVLGAGAIADFRAAIVLYGGGVMLSWGDEPTTPYDLIKNIRCPVIGFSGGLDPNPSPENMAKISAEMTRCGVAHDFHLYPDVGHGFHNPTRGKPEEKAARNDSWKKIFDFLRRVAPVPVSA